MKNCLLLKLFLEVFVIGYATASLDSNQSFQYEKINSYGLGRRAIENFRRVNPSEYAYPNPLPSSVAPKPFIRDPYRSLYQGARRKSKDVRVFKKDFEYPPIDIGQRILCESLVNCKISHVAIETEDGIPIILRGGVGYRHFTVIVRAKPGNPLKGTIGVYCTRTSDNQRPLVAGGKV